MGGAPLSVQTKGGYTDRDVFSIEPDLVPRGGQTAQVVSGGTLGGVKSFPVNKPTLYRGRNREV